MSRNGNFRYKACRGFRLSVHWRCGVHSALRPSSCFLSVYSSVGSQRTQTSRSPTFYLTLRRNMSSRSQRYFWRCWWEIQHTCCHIGWLTSRIWTTQRIACQFGELRCDKATSFWGVNAVFEYFIRWSTRKHLSRAHTFQSTYDLTTEDDRACITRFISSLTDFSSGIEVAIFSCWRKLVFSVKWNCPVCPVGCQIALWCQRVISYPKCLRTVRNWDLPITSPWKLILFGLTLSLLRAINFKFPLQPQKKLILVTQYLDFS